MTAETVLITGGSRGIGAAAVRAFTAAGYPVVFLYEKSDEDARRVTSETGALAFKADVADEKAVCFAFDQAQARVGGIGILINNAAISGFRLFQDISAEEWNRMLAVNLSGAFHCVRAALPGMLSRKRGVIVNVSSIWGLVGASCESHYATTKAGLIGLTKSLAKELGPSGIRVNCVAPGVIETEMNQSLSAEDRQSLAVETPLGRLGTPAEVARSLLFLASDESAFITGQVLSPNGGLIV